MMQPKGKHAMNVRTVPNRSDGRIVAGVGSRYLGRVTARIDPGLTRPRATRHAVGGSPGLDRRAGGAPDPEATVPDPTRVGDLSAARLESELVALAARLASGTYELLVLVGEFDVRGLWRLHGALSCARWLANLCGIEISTARRQVQVARALREHPILDAAMRTGDVSYAKARVLVPFLDPENAAELVALAESTPAGRLGAAIAARSQRKDDPEDIARRQWAARSCSWRTDPDGLVTFTMRLTPAAAGAVIASIDTTVMQNPSMECAPAGAGDEGDAPVRRSSLAQQRADAVVEMLTSPAGGAGGVEAEVVVHVTADGNRLTDGTPLADHTVTRILPDAFVSLLLHDGERQPVDASPRRRFPTRRQRRVIDARQGECQHPGCDATSFLQYDHIVDYSAGGSTVIDNLQRLCGPHNRGKSDARPDRGWTRSGTS